MFLCILNFENGYLEENKNPAEHGISFQLVPSTNSVANVEASIQTSGVCLKGGTEGVSLPSEVAAEGNKPLGFVGIC